MLPRFEPTGPGQGPHWERLAAWLAEQLPAREIDGVWVFRVLRREQREFGTAVLSRVDGDRRRIYTARYTATIKGKQRGAFQPELIEVVALVPVRSDDEEPPEPVDRALWFPAAFEQVELELPAAEG
jgi:hypothetical protein